MAVATHLEPFGLIQPDPPSFQQGWNPETPAHHHDGAILGSGFHRKDGGRVQVIPAGLEWHVTAGAWAHGEENGNRLLEVARLETLASLTVGLLQSLQF